MVRLFFLIAVGFVLMAQSATAGAWLREKGTTFTSTSFVLNKDLESANTTYLEHGLSDKMTVGVDFGQFRTRYALPTGFTTFFLRRAIGRADRKSKLADELGVGTGWKGDVLIPHIKTGLSYGRGMKIREKGGWISVDGSVTWDLVGGEHIAKLDTTAGLNFSDRWSGMLQVYIAHIDHETFTTLAPSVLLTSRNGRMKYQFGAENPLHGGGQLSLKLGVWSEF